MEAPKPNPISAYREAPVRLMVYRIAILSIAAFMINEIANGTRPMLSAVFLLLLMAAFYFRRRQYIWIYENELLFHIGVPVSFSKSAPKVQQFALNSIQGIEVYKKGSFLWAPNRKMIEIRYTDGSSKVLNCTLFSKSDFEKIETQVRAKLPEEKIEVEKLD